jgi:hypothetical protein
MPPKRKITDADNVNGNAKVRREVNRWTSKRGFTRWSQNFIKPGTAVPVHVMKASGGSSGEGLLIHNLDIRWRWLVSYISRPLYSRG